MSSYGTNKSLWLTRNPTGPYAEPMRHDEASDALVAASITEFLDALVLRRFGLQYSLR
jgi:hypothetical protein